MKKTIKLLFGLIAILCFFSFSGCSNAEKVSVDDIDYSNIKVRVDMCGGYELVQYVTILTNDNKIISFDGRQDTEATVVSLKDNAVDELVIKQSLDSLQGCESEDVDYFVTASDNYYIEMHIGEEVYRYTYGCAKNPDANILTELLLSYSKVEEIDDISPYPSKFRKIKT